MDEKSYNEPAFPNVGAISDHQFNGMTLRDYFAAKAMQALMDQSIGATARSAAAYREADAMLAERAK